MTNVELPSISTIRAKIYLVDKFRLFWAKREMIFQNAFVRNLSGTQNLITYVSHSQMRSQRLSKSSRQYKRQNCFEQDTKLALTVVRQTHDSGIGNRVLKTTKTMVGFHWFIAPTFQIIVPQLYQQYDYWLKNGLRLVIVLQYRKVRNCCDRNTQAVRIRKNVLYDKFFENKHTFLKCKSIKENIHIGKMPNLIHDFWRNRNYNTSFFFKRNLGNFSWCLQRTGRVFYALYYSFRGNALGWKKWDFDLRETKCIECWAFRNELEWKREWCATLCKKRELRIIYSVFCIINNSNLFRDTIFCAERNLTG